MPQEEDPSDAILDEDESNALWPQEDNYHDDGEFCSVALASTGEILISTSHATTDGAPGDQETMPQSFKGESGQPGGCLP